MTVFGDWKSQSTSVNKIDPDRHMLETDPPRPKKPLEYFDASFAHSAPEDDIPLGYPELEFARLLLSQPAEFGKTDGSCCLNQIKNCRFEILLRFGRGDTAHAIAH